MFSANRIMSDYIVNLADVSTYGCDPMSFEDLREEFEVFAVTEADEMSPNF
ncbi:hypothetical protein [Rhizobium sp. FY34]|uniref:hypothetical protein n=1 Tax=Rhizobium sp. FY34 TaxID=2562309 RepID=UPI0014853DDD|nr:hypothetical protein [Rhizobium sp. FY34]